AADGGVTLPGGAVLPLPVPRGGDLRLGLRPEHMRMAEPGEAAIPVVLRSVERLGADAFGYGMIEGSDVSFVLRLPGTSTLDRGDRVEAVPDPAHLHFFDPESGKRIEG